MLTRENIDYLLEREEKLGAAKVRRECRQYIMRRTYAGEVKEVRAKLSPAKKRDMYVKQKGRCAGCFLNFDIKELECDEFIPASRGGKRERGNIRLLCADCNKRKSNHTPSEEAKRIGKTVFEQVKEQMERDSESEEN